MSDIICKLKTELSNSSSTVSTEALAASNITKVANEPNFYSLDINIVKRILDKCGKLEIKTISNIMKNGIKYYGETCLTLFNHIECGSVGERIVDVLDELTCFPVIREAVSSMRQKANIPELDKLRKAINTLQSENKSLKSEIDHGIDVDWETLIEKEKREKENLKRQLNSSIEAQKSLEEQLSKSEKMVNDLNDFIRRHPPPPCVRHHPHPGPHPGPHHGPHHGPPTPPPGWTEEWPPRPPDWKGQWPPDHPPPHHHGCGPHPPGHHHGPPPPGHHHGGPPPWARGPR